MIDADRRDVEPGSTVLEVFRHRAVPPHGNVRLLSVRHAPLPSPLPFGERGFADRRPDVARDHRGPGTHRVLGDSHARESACRALEPGQIPQPPSGPAPLDILARRFAAGEISADEYQKVREVLAGPPKP